jgi:hypothetical protein
VNKESFHTKLIYLCLFYNCFLDTKTEKVRCFQRLLGLPVQECVTDKHLDVNLISDVFLAVYRTGFHISCVVIFWFFFGFGDQLRCPKKHALILTNGV